jgi:anti-anti-sigma regulatory factor
MLSALLSAWWVRPAAVATAAPSRAVPEGAGRPRPAWYDAAPRRRREPAPGLEVTASETADGMVIGVKGVAGTDQSGALLSSLLAPSARRPAAVTLDLSGLSFISSLAMSVLTAYRRGVVRAGGRVVLAGGLQPAVREALDRAELMGLFGDVGGEQQGNRVA